MTSPSPKSASLSPAEETALSALNDIGGRNNNSNNNFPNSTGESAREMTKEAVRIPTPEAAQPSEVAPFQTDTAITVAEVSEALPLPPPSSAASAPEESTSHRHPTVPSLYSRLQYGLSQVAAANSPQTQQQPVRPANPGPNGLMPGAYPSLPPLPLHLQLAQIMSTPATNGAGAHAQLEQMNNLMQLASYVQNNVSPAQDPFPQRRIVPVKRDVEEESEEDDGIAPTEDEQRQLDAAIAAAETSGASRQEMKYMCQTCSRVFTRLYNLKSHIRSHQGLRPYKCRSCGASFTRNHDLNRHERTHVKTKPFQCAVCSKNFSRKDALKRHQRQDSDRKKSICVPPSELMQEES